jgi:hypothetical protein
VPVSKVASQMKGQVKKMQEQQEAAMKEFEEQQRFQQQAANPTSTQGTRKIEASSHKLHAASEFLDFDNLFILLLLICQLSTSSINYYPSKAPNPTPFSHYSTEWFVNLLLGRLQYSWGCHQ